LSICSCKPNVNFDKLRAMFIQDSSIYNQYACFLLQNRRAIETNLSVSKNNIINKQNDTLYSHVISDSLTYYATKGLSQAFSFSKDGGIEFFISSKSSLARDYELRVYYYFGDTVSAITLYKHSYGKVKVNDQWWIIAMLDAYY
jgi:hypothetical protein